LEVIFGCKIFEAVDGKQLALDFIEDEVLYRNPEIWMNILRIT
jgi:hypothetical protein